MTSNKVDTPTTDKWVKHPRMLNLDNPLPPGLDIHRLMRERWRCDFAMFEDLDTDISGVLLPEDCDESFINLMKMWEEDYISLLDTEDPSVEDPTTP